MKIKKTIFSVMIFTAVFIFGGCEKQSEQPSIQKTLPEETVTKEVMSEKNLTLSSSAFEENDAIPAKYTCDGDDVNPALSVENISEDAQSLALIMDDPDAPVGVWDHWVVWNIPVSGDSYALDENEEPVGRIGKGSSGDMKYQGPCPPGGEHRYFFKVYALDMMLELAEGSIKAQLEKAMEGHILQSAKLMGVYSR